MTHPTRLDDAAIEALISEASSAIEECRQGVPDYEDRLLPRLYKALRQLRADLAEARKDADTAQAALGAARIELEDAYRELFQLAELPASIEAQKTVDKVRQLQREVVLHVKDNALVLQEAASEVRKWFKRAEELRADLATVTKERDEARADWCKLREATMTIVDDPE